MVSVAEATSIVLNNLTKPSIISLPISESIGRVLAEKVFADRDLPPVNRVTMDGIAIAFDVWQSGTRSFPIDDTLAAGSPARILSNQTNCYEIMTGAVLPGNTDTVIPYEDIEIKARVAIVLASKVIKGQSIHEQGTDAWKGELLLQQGIMLSAAEIALLASVGKSVVNVYEFPKTAIISSGDELVSIDSLPLPHQVRRSNAYAIQAAMQTMGWNGSRFHLRDVKEEMKTTLSEIVEYYDVLILSGGVSKGKFDYVPEVMEALGIEKLFHRVSQKPGKPFWFGASSDGKIVFALPGNPVSTYMCFYRYIRPWIMRCLGIAAERQQAILATDYTPSKELTYFLQVRIVNERGMLMAYPETGGGSGDFANLKKVTGFLELPPHQQYNKGEVFDYFHFR